ncbi:hypothetical protein SNEBB_010995 [Seison nebaliae]|nr:hypothetical protein SNEBB_010995 [Seison nebaliae]
MIHGSHSIHLVNYLDEPLGTTLTIFLIIESIVGLIGNGLVIGAVFISKDLRNTGIGAIVNIAICDSIICIIVNPSIIFGVYMPATYFSRHEIFCDILGSICVTGCICNVLNVVVICIARYAHLMNKKMFNKFFNSHVKEILLSATTWLIAFVCDVPNFLQWGKHIFDHKTRMCHWDRTGKREIYAIIFSCISCFLPLCVLFIFYSLMFLHIRKSKLRIFNNASEMHLSERSHDTSTLNVRHVNKRKQLFKKSLRMAKTLKDLFPAWVHIFAIQTAHFSIILNPLIYVLQIFLLRMSKEEFIPSHSSYILTVYLVIASILGFFGNLLIIGAIIVSKELKRSGNGSVINIAITDIVVATIVNPITILGIYMPTSFFYKHKWICEVAGCICVTGCICNIFNIVFICITRYIHMARGKLYRKLFSPAYKELIISIIIWILAFFCDLPNFLGVGGHIFDHKTRMCHWDRLSKDGNVYAILFACIACFLPMLTLSIFYLLIFAHVRESKRKVECKDPNLKKNSGSLKKNKSMKSSIRLAKTLFLIVLVFIICWLPYGMVTIIDRFDEWPHWVHICSIQLAHAGVILNFFIYGLANRNFRIAYCRILGLGKYFPEINLETTMASTAK